ncbi:hypothetical protein F2P79_001153 [Pimephales promelas]|nr:hypothetical protein F2P79_001153 [Pimephales promelas]
MGDRSDDEAREADGETRGREESRDAESRKSMAGTGLRRFKVFEDRKDISGPDESNCYVLDEP